MEELEELVLVAGALVTGAPVTGARVAGVLVAGAGELCAGVELDAGLGAGAAWWAAGRRATWRAGAGCL